VTDPPFDAFPAIETLAFVVVELRTHAGSVVRRMMSTQNDPAGPATVARKPVHPDAGHRRI
jgi:hypothetical protein